MKRIPFLILVFMLTTGFFKSALEKCADIDIRDAPQFNKNGIYKDVEMSDAEKIVAKKYWEKRDKEYKKKINQRDISLDIRFFIEQHNLGPKTHKSILVRKITKKENDKKHKKFISQSLKKKMNDRFSGYPEKYELCVNYKKFKPEMFKAKYD
jgi:hypothetical protein